MGGGLLQLVAYGAQDVYLTGNPSITCGYDYIYGLRYREMLKKTKNKWIKKLYKKDYSEYMVYYICSYAYFDNIDEGDLSDDVCYQKWLELEMYK